MTHGKSPGGGRSGWVWLALAIVWVIVVRVPLVINARAHLDSDLAVDGLTLLEAVNGHWRWHYPATPFIGIVPVLLSWPQVMIGGATPSALVSGGVVAYLGLVVATFVMNRRAFGTSVATWGLVPLAFASVGAVWLSGRVTGGHLMAAFWQAGAFALLVNVLKRGGAGRSLGLGVWSGVGLYVDTMFAVSLAGLMVAAVIGGRASSSGRAVVCVLAFGLGFGLGVTPRFVGAWADPHDAYEGQLEPVFRGDVLARNAKILGLDCLPRLIAGHRLPGLQTEPALTSEKAFSPWALGVTVVALGLFARGLMALVVGPSTSEDRVSVAIRWGLLASMAGVVAGFLVNRTISNSDHYRYLVTFLVPWSSGFGLAMTGIAGKKPVGWVVAGALSIALAGLMAVDTARWYAGMGWIDGSGRPVRKVAEDPALVWLLAHPEVTAILGDYWDVYRLSYLTGGRVQGVPFPEYPDRFPEIAQGLPGHRPEFVVVRPGPVGPRYRAQVLAEGGREVERSAGLSILSWPRGTTP